MSSIRVALRSSALWVGVLGLGAGLAAQRTALELRLASDAAPGAPAAWRLVRREILARVPGWPTDVSPTDAIRVTVDETGKLTARRDPSPLEQRYAEFELSIGPDVVVSGACDATGTERWRLDAGTAATNRRLKRLFDRFAPDASTGGLTVDLPALIGNLMGGAAHGDALGELLTLAPLECGDVEVVAVPSDGDDTVWRVIGHSGGGLLLPALLVAIADAQAAGMKIDAPVAGDEVDRCVLLATTATGDEQLEAARQLSRFDDPRAIHALEGLLHADGDLRLVARMGLARLEALEPSSETTRRATPARIASVRNAVTTPSQPAAPRAAWTRAIVLAFLLGFATAVVTCLAVRHHRRTPHGEGA